MKHLTARIALYLSYFFQKVDEHSLQGPFAFDFTTRILRGKTVTDFSDIEARRDQLKKSDREVPYFTFGEMSKLSSHSRKRIADIAKSGISSQKKSELFYRIVNSYDLKVIVELGTSLGINTCYLARAGKDGKVITFEGHPDLADLASETFNELRFNHIKLVRGDIDESIDHTISRLEKVDFVFIDANHSSAALVKYFEIFLPKIHDRCVMVIDDIRWSRDMFVGWKKVIKHTRISHIFDLGDLGVLFFRPNTRRQHFVLHF